VVCRARCWQQSSFSPLKPNQTSAGKTCYLTKPRSLKPSSTARHDVAQANRCLFVQLQAISGSLSSVSMSIAAQITVARSQSNKTHFTEMFEQLKITPQLQLLNILCRLILLCQKMLFSQWRNYNVWAPGKHSLRALVHLWTSTASSNRQSTTLQNVSVYRVRHTSSEI